MLDKTKKASTNLDDYEMGTRAYHAVGVHNYFHNMGMHNKSFHAKIDELNDTDMEELFEHFCAGDARNASVDYRNRAAN